MELREALLCAVLGLGNTRPEGIGLLRKVENLGQTRIL